MNAETRVPFLVKCWTCKHVWPAAYLPMPLAKVAEVMKLACCPMCGETSDKISSFYFSPAGDVSG